MVYNFRECPQGNTTPLKIFGESRMEEAFPLSKWNYF